MRAREYCLYSVTSFVCEAHALLGATWTTYTEEINACCAVLYRT